jgi:hypothetical protein
MLEETNPGIRWIGNAQTGVMNMVMKREICAPSRESEGCELDDRG